MNRVLLRALRRRIGSALAYGFLHLLIAFPPGAHGAEYFVAPYGSPNATGTFTDPWDLQTALNHPPLIMGDDVIWMRGGIYRKNGELTRYTSTLKGGTHKPIVVRQYPGERAIVDGNVIQYSGGSVHYWGFEIMNSHTNRVTTQSGSFPTAFYLLTGGQTNDWAVSGFDLRAPNVKLINLVVHDSIGGGISANTSATGPEVYGNLSYYNGWQGCDRGHGHGIYIQSRDPSSAIIADNLFFANYALGIQATGNGAVVDNILFEGNAAFSNSILARRHQGNILVGPAVGYAKNPVLIQNCIYDVSGSLSDSNIGYTGGSTNAVVAGNYFQTSVHFSEDNEGLSVVGNTFLGSTSSLPRSNYPNNIFMQGIPESNVIVVRTNKYESGRATIIIYNWEKLESVQVDVGSFLAIGTPFEVRSAQNIRGAAVLCGTYDGNLLDLPLKALPVSKPVGGNAPASTAATFQVFIIQPTEPPDMWNTAPTISSIPDSETSANVQTEPISFTIYDAETPPAYLNLSVLSSNPELVPHRNIRIEGTGTLRIMTINPAPNQTGSALIKLGISDGFKHAETAFNVQVMPSVNPIDEDMHGGRLTITVDDDHAMIRAIGQSDFDYMVQVSTNLVQWRFIGTISTDCNGSGSFHEHSTGHGVPRYYRLQQATVQPTHR